MYNRSEIVRTANKLSGNGLTRSQAFKKAWELAKAKTLIVKGVTQGKRQTAIEHIKQRQRVTIARALSLDPDFIIADEPIASLDAFIQAQIINLFKKLQKDRGLTCLFISHGLSMVKFVTDRMGVMYKGQIVEMAETKELYRNPVYPYTKALFSSILVPDPEEARKSTHFNYDPILDKQFDGENDFLEVTAGHYVSSASLKSKFILEVAK